MQGNCSTPSAVLYNGYDLEDLPEAEPDDVSGTVVRFVYTGTTYQGKRDLTPLLCALKKRVPHTKIEFHYAGPEGGYVQGLFDGMGLTSILRNHGRVSRPQALRLTQMCDFIVVATWDEAAHRGVIPGKLAESMMFGKPIICLISGIDRAAEIEEIIKDNKLGFSHYSSNRPDEQLDFERNVNTILAERNNPSRKRLVPPKTFDYERIALEYQSIISKLEVRG
jgi:glycosyltransferase involved in cell wall biosynthesis